MPRIARKQSGTGIYHVMLRGINRQDIFEDAEDYWTFIRIVSCLYERLDDDLQTRVCTCYIYAYCIMPNHVHLLIHEKEWTISEVVKSVAAAYVHYYNKKYGRIGHLFQDRFRSEPCNDADYFITLFRYIHQNPIKAGLCRHAKDYEYSSWGNDYLGLSAQRVCHCQTVVRRYTMKELEAWVDMPLTDQYGIIDIEERKVIADVEVREAILRKCGARTIVEFRLHDKERQKDIAREVMQELGAGPRQMSRVSGMNYSEVYRLTKR